MSSNPYAPPKAVVADIPPPLERSPPLWNPKAAFFWSWVFTPAFGAFLHMYNWEELGEPKKAAAAKIWGMVIVSILAVVALLANFIPTLNVVTTPVGIVLLFSWYSSSAREQVRYVKQRFGDEYPRRGWGRPLFMAVLALLGYAVIVGTITVLLGSAGVGIAGN